MKTLAVRRVVLLFLFASAAVAAFEICTSASLRIRTQDHNGDGRPDVWRHYDAKGLLTRVAVDSNFDGRADVEEYYERGALVRRESDRNFNGQADLIEDFDTDTHEPNRSVVDVDFDGTADLLVLFRDGRPVFSRHAGPQQRSGNLTADRSGAADYLDPLSNPFDSDLAMRALRLPAGADGSAGLSASGGLPSQRAAVIGPHRGSAQLAARDIHAPAFTLSPHRSPRAPPLSL